MSLKNRARRNLAAFSAILLASSALLPLAHATETTGGASYEYTLLTQSNFTVVDRSSVEPALELPNGPVEKILDGDINSFWHSKYGGGIAPAPHHVTVDLGAPVLLGKLAITPRQSSTGSGRTKSYEVWTSIDPTCNASTFIRRTTGSFPGDTDTATQVREIVLEEPIEARCVKYVQTESWGGKRGVEPISPNDPTATMAEFNAYSATPINTPNTGEGGTPAQPVDTTPTLDPNTQYLVLTDGNLNVTMHPNFPQVAKWELNGSTAFGNTGAALTQVTINEVAKDVTVTPAVKTGENTARWAIAVNDTQIRFDAVATVIDGVWKLKLENLTDPDNAVNRIVFPGLNLVTLQASDAGSDIAANVISVNRAVNGDFFAPVSQLSGGTLANYMVVPSTSELSFGMENNAIEDNTTRYPGSNRGSNARWISVTSGVGSAKKVSISPGNFVWRGSSATVIGYDEAPWIAIKPTLDANNDSVVDWQDGAIAMRTLRPAINGSADVAKTVITRIPFNIVSQATHPFLRTLDDTKRVSLATDNLRQQVMLKGYQAEGHDSAHPDYAGHYNDRAGGFKDLETLVNEGQNWNSVFGVHVNATESYSESYNFSEELLKMPPQAAWGWMNQSYYIDGPKDLGTGKVVERFQDFWNEVPRNLKWLYIDVYYPDGWEPDRLGVELQKQGWVVGTEWADKFPELSVWSHWANDENYGGQRNKGINSQIFRFVENTRRDVFNPHPILSNSNVVEFEGWTGHVNYHPFIRNIWERNLPTKFLQQSEIMKWENNSITFANGTVATSPLNTIDGRTIPTNRTINFDGAVVYEQGRYLLPWRDGGTDRLYHWNPAGGSSTWTLTNAWRGQSSLSLFKLTDTGRVHVADVPVNGGSVTLNTEANTAYVLYPTSAVPQPKAPNWGQGSNIADPGFFSGTLDHWTVEGTVTVGANERGNQQATLGENGSLSQVLAGGNLPAGTYNVSAWVEIDPLKERPVTLSVSGNGVTPTNLQAVVDGKPATTITTSRAINATASDQLLRTYFQRVRVTFVNPTDGAVTVKLSAGEGDAVVKVDDFRIVKFVEHTLPEGATNPIAFEDFEHPDAGYWPFVTGKDNQRGDARTQLAERHEPYSQRGWWGKDASGRVVEGGKLVDNVLTGKWSLQAHEENQGLILRTTPATVPFKAGHRYRISMDYQSGLADRYRFVTAFDSIVDNAVHSTHLSHDNFPATTQTERFTTELSVGTCGPHWFGIEKIGTGFQADLTMDNILVEDLGKAETIPACAELQIAPQSPLISGKGSVVTTTIVSSENAEGTEVEHYLEAPEGWTVVPLVEAPKTIDAKGTSVQRWIVTPPADYRGSAILEGTAIYNIDGVTKVVAAHYPATVMGEGLGNGTNYLSDLPFAGTPQNGWGPVERDQSNGEQGQNDGAPISVGGTVYDKGLGTHSNSRVAFDLNGKCNRFTATVGVDDRQASAGTVRFSVQDGNGRVLYGPSPVQRHDSPGLPLDIDITGVDRLVLIVDNAGDNFGNDWGSWGDAKVECEVASDVTPPTLTVTPETVRPGDTITLEIAGFASETATGNVEIREAERGTVVATITPSATGTGSATFQIPDTAVGGPVELVAVRANGNHWLTASDNITVDLPVVPATAVLDEVRAYHADEVVVTGRDFQANEIVSIELHSTPIVLAQTVRANANGELRFAFNVPAEATVGAHHVVIKRTNAQLEDIRLALEVLKKPVDPAKPVDPVKPPLTDSKPVVAAPKAPATVKPVNLKGLAHTGASVEALLISSMLVLSAGAVALYKRRKHAE